MELRVSATRHLLPIMLTHVLRASNAYL